ncbi:hypothetical protein Angca_007290, partial [Angiostrongylus cantonensis]
GSLLSFDKQGNVVSMQMVGRLDATGILIGARNSHLNRRRIVESEGVMQIIRALEKKHGKYFRTAAIIDLNGASLLQLDVQAVKVTNTIPAQLQEIFADVLRKVFLINVPLFLQVFWNMVSSCLAKQTQEKIKILGSNWKVVLLEAVGEEVVYENWGGIHKADTPFGHVRMGGKAPDEL